MEIHQIRYFVAVANTGNFTRAAETVHVSQPSLSQQIQKLEGELGRKLFDRLGRRAELTSAGQVFYERAVRILQDVDDAARAVAEDAGRGQLRFGVIPSVAPYLLPDLLPRLKPSLANIELEVLEDFRSYLIEQIVAGRLELAIVTMPPDEPVLEIEPLFIEPLLVVMPEKHPLAAKKNLLPSDLEGQRLVLLGDSSSLALQTERFFGDNRVRVEVACRCAQVKTVKSLVAAGLGLAILPRMAAGRDGVPGLVYRELMDPSPQREIVMVRHRQRFHGRVEETFRQLVRDCCGERYGALK